MRTSTNLLPGSAFVQITPQCFSIEAVFHTKRSWVGDLKRPWQFIHLHIWWSGFTNSTPSRVTSPVPPESHRLTMVKWTKKSSNTEPALYRVKRNVAFSSYYHKLRQLVLFLSFVLRVLKMIGSDADVVSSSYRLRASQITG